MTTRRSGLGRGLSALIPGDATGPASTASALVELALTDVVPNRHQPRAAFDEEALTALTGSISELGVLQPILVRSVGDGTYELIAGERRWRAAKRAGFQTIPALVRDVDDGTSLEHALVENLQRADLNSMEEAAAYQQLIEEFGLTHDQVAARVGKSRAAISNTLRLFQLPPAIQRLVSEGRISAGHARALLGTPDRAYQERLARQVLADGLSVRDVEDAVRERTGLAADGEGEPATPPATRAAVGRDRLVPGLVDLEELFSEHLETRVKIKLRGGHGQIVVEFADLEDLERIYRLVVVIP
ncbi:MAG: ParB/RepB/Spo0J family partition protein [Acidimicrobiales bacterium]